MALLRQTTRVRRPGAILQRPRLPVTSRGVLSRIEVHRGSRRRSPCSRGRVCVPRGRTGCRGWACLAVSSRNSGSGGMGRWAGVRSRPGLGRVYGVGALGGFVAGAWGVRRSRWGGSQGRAVLDGSLERGLLSLAGELGFVARDHAEEEEG